MKSEENGVISWTSLCLLFLALLPCCGQPALGQIPEYFVDVLVVCDAPVYNAWLSRARPAPGETARDLALADTRQYFTLVMKEVNARFRTLEEYNNFRLTVRPVGFVIAE
ncbi:hypothetical protein BaRGS_00035622, partial [Batillaria attramentaria]